MKKLFLVAIVLLLPCIAKAANPTCTAAPTCEILGYKYTTKSCTTLGLKYVSCPFDTTKVACVSNLPGESNGNVSVENACKEAGYRYSADQCGKTWHGSNPWVDSNIGIPCPYDTESKYFYCESPNKNAERGDYLCADGTAKKTMADCDDVVGVVIQGKSPGSKGIAVLTDWTTKSGKGREKWATSLSSWCSQYPGQNPSASTPTWPTPNTGKSIASLWPRISSVSSRLSLPIWVDNCAWDGGSNTCYIVTKDGVLQKKSVDQEYNLLCVVEF